jgi:hypothetical protein
MFNVTDAKTAENSVCDIGLYILCVHVCVTGGRLLNPRHVNLSTGAVRDGRESH